MLYQLHETFLYQRNHIYPDLSRQVAEKGNVFIQERDYRLNNYITDITNQPCMSNEDCTLTKRVSALSRLHTEPYQEDLKSLAALIQKLRSWGVVHVNNEHLSLVQILFNWVNENLQYATVNASDDKRLQESADMIMKGLSFLMVTFDYFQRNLKGLKQSIDVVTASIKECIPGEDLKGAEYMERFLEIITGIDHRSKRWVYLSSPWMIEHMDDEKNAPYSSTKNDQRVLFRKRAISREVLQSMIPQQFAIMLKVMKNFTSVLMAFTKEYDIDGLYEHLKQNKTSHIQFKQLSLDVIITVKKLKEQHRKEGNLLLVHLETLAKNGKVGDDETEQLLTRVATFLQHHVMLAVELQEKNVHLKKWVIDAIKNGPEFSDPLLASINMEFIDWIEHVNNSVSALNEMVQPLFGWHIAVEQQQSHHSTLNESDKLDFLPPSLKKKGAAKPKGKVPLKKSLAKREINVIAPSNKSDSQVTKSKIVPVPVRKQETQTGVEQMLLDTDPLSLKPSQLVIRTKQVAAPRIKLANALERADMQHPFSPFLKDKDVSIIKTAAHAGLNYNLLKGLTGLNDSVNSGRPDEVLFLCRTAIGSVNLFMEAAIRLAIIKNEKTVDAANHNLWKFSRDLNENNQSGVIRKHYLASYWTRFMREQMEGWQESGKPIPEILRTLVDVADRKPAACAKVQESVRSWIEESIALGNELIEKELESEPTLTVPHKVGHSQDQASAMDISPWKDLIHEVEKLANKGNVFINQWLDDIRSLNGAWSLIDRAGSAEEYALITSSVHGFLHAAAQSPLYAMQQEFMLNKTTDHRLANLWDQTFKDSKTRFPEAFQELLNEASISSRYPYSNDQPTSVLHRQQLEAIALISLPDLNEGFEPVKANKTERAFDPETGMPRLNRVGAHEVQKAALKSVCIELATLLKKQILPEVQARI